jgi:uncharacterized protein (TIGR04255 family)
MSSSGNPDYASPPVVETVLSLQFDPIERLNGPAFGLLWSQLKVEFPECHEAAYLEPAFERFDAPATWNLPGFEFKQGVPPTRWQLSQPETGWMVQFQKTRFLVNWIGHDGRDYPRYPAVREFFVRQWSRFLEFLHDQGIERPRLNQWEVTYLNHIPQGTVWTAPQDWTFCKLLGNLPPSIALDFEGYHGSWQFAIPEQRGRLHCSWKHGFKTSKRDTTREADKIVVLELTARGPLQDQGDPFVYLDLGRQTIVTTFEQLMTDAANKYWGIK